MSLTTASCERDEDELKEIGGQVQKIARKVETTHVLSTTINRARASMGLVLWPLS